MVRIQPLPRKKNMPLILEALQMYGSISTKRTSLFQITKYESKCIMEAPGFLSLQVKHEKIKINGH